jgi:16S rRNA (adenine1518-N6/adenine1519-N6)-dimethyltransferase
MHPKQLLASYDLEPKKSLGQNFLFDENVLARIVDAAALTPQDQLLEIGPGLGSLTRLLARHVARVVAIELDGRFTPILQAQLAEFHNVELIHADILDQNPANFFQSQYKVVANVPFYITGAILRHLLGSTVKPSLMVLTVQKEVAERITAVPPNMSLLSVSVQYYGHPQIVTIIKAGAFWPRPDVDSSVIRIDLAQGPAERNDPVQENHFFRLVRVGFSQKRKQLQKNLRQLQLNQEQIDHLLQKSGIDGRRRAETLSLDEWHALTQAIEQA